MVRIKIVKITTNDKFGNKPKEYMRTVYITKKGEYVNWFGKRLYLVVVTDGIPMIISHPFIDKIHTVDPRI